MKKVIVTLFFITLCCFAKAQLIVDDFESNNLGWTEDMSSSRVAVIKDGHLHLEGKSAGVISSCYAPVDIDKPFEIKCEAFVKSLTGSKHFGIVMDYEDDMNYISFTIEDDRVVVDRIVEDKLIGKKSQPLKLTSKKKTGIDFRIEYSLQKLTLFINEMKVIEYQRRVEKGDFMLGTTGIGFYAGKNTEVDFDNFQIIQ